MKRTQRILGRQLAKELSPEDLGLVSGSETVVTTTTLTRSGQAVAGGDDTGPPVSTLVATLPDYHEDQ
jgi:hypothetical protein